MARYQPGKYKAPEPHEIEVEGLGSFLVKPLSNREQEAIQAKVAKDGGDDEERGKRTSYAYLSACLVEPEMEPEQIEEEIGNWTVRQGEEFISKVLRAAEVLDEEDLADVRRRFRSEDDD